MSRNPGNTGHRYKMVKQTGVEINKYGFPVVFMECGHHVVCSLKWATAEEIVASVTAHIGMKQRCEECAKGTS